MEGTKFVLSIVIVQQSNNKKQSKQQMYKII